MKAIRLSLFIVLHLACNNVYSQNPVQAAVSASISGSIEVPPLQSVNVVILNERPLDFGSIDDYHNGKTIPSYCQVEVKSNYPWQLSAVINPASIAEAYSSTSPGSFLSIKPQNTNTFIPLSTTPVKILQSDNNNLYNRYLIDLNVKPDLNFRDGAYDINISFLLSPQ